MFTRQLIKRIPQVGVRNLAIRTLSTIPPPQKSEAHLRNLDIPTQEAPQPTAVNTKPTIQQEDYWTRNARINFMDVIQVVLNAVLFVTASAFVAIFAYHFPLLFIFALLLFAWV